MFVLKYEYRLNIYKTYYYIYFYFYLKLTRSKNNIFKNIRIYYHYKNLIIINYKIS